MNHTPEPGNCLPGLNTVPVKKICEWCDLPAHVTYSVCNCEERCKAGQCAAQDPDEVRWRL